ncbi:MAG: hypothetical protein QCI38_02395 [Candidatus Thermoplasmatota archaeon]|nr:hypothetical protein [Candidatus Thermoplasmatota archaeon]
MPCKFCGKRTTRFSTPHGPLCADCLGIILYVTERRDKIIALERGLKKVSIHSEEKK